MCSQLNALSFTCDCASQSVSLLRVIAPVSQSLFYV
jgi:hypothetical protein